MITEGNPKWKVPMKSPHHKISTQNLGFTSVILRKMPYFKNMCFSRCFSLDLPIVQNPHFPCKMPNTLHFTGKIQNPSFPNLQPRRGIHNFTFTITQRCIIRCFEWSRWFIQENASLGWLCVLMNKMVWKFDYLKWKWKYTQQL